MIKPLSPAAVPLIGWRLSNIGEPRSRLVLEGLPTCANCHSFSSVGLHIYRQAGIMVVRVP